MSACLFNCEDHFHFHISLFAVNMSHYIYFHSSRIRIAKPNNFSRIYFTLFLYISSSSYDVRLPNFAFSVKRLPKNNGFRFLFLNLDTDLKN